MDVTTTTSRARRQLGAALAEAAIALPILIVVFLAAIQFGFVYQAKATLNHAVLQAARAGAVRNGEPAALRHGLALGLAPLSSPDASMQGAAEAVARIEAKLLTDARIRILNPTRESFDDFAIERDGVRELPNDRLHTLGTELGTRGGLNVQDANLLRVEVTYGYELKVPLVNGFLSRLSLLTTGEIDPFHEQLLRRNRLPISATATVRMQSPLRFSELLVSRADLPEVPRVAAANVGTSGDSESRDGDGSAEGETESSPGTDNRGSSLGDGFFGFGSGSGRSAGASNDNDADTRDDSGDTEDEGTGTPPGEQPLCTPTPSSSQQTSADPSTLGRVWDELRGLARGAYEFVRGLIISSAVKDFGMKPEAPACTARAATLCCSSPEIMMQAVVGKRSPMIFSAAKPSSPFRWMSSSTRPMSASFCRACSASGTDETLNTPASSALCSSTA